MARHQTGSGFQALLLRVKHGRILVNSIYGIAIVISNALLGYFFWTAAAHFYSPRAVGVAAAVISAFTVASTFSNLGVGTGLIQRLPSTRDSDGWRLAVTTAMTVGSLAGLFASAIALLIVPRLSHSLQVLLTLPYVVAFGAGVLFWTVSIIFDSVFIAERAVKLSFFRNLAFSAGKLGLLVVPATLLSASALGIVTSWVVGCGLSLVVGVYLISCRLERRLTPIFTGTLTEVRHMRTSLIGHHVINLGGQLPMYLFPLLVTARLGPRENAFSYAAWMVGSIALVASPTVASQIFAEGSRDPQQVDQHLRRGMLVMTGLMAIPMLGMFVFAKYILLSFGPAYAAHGTLLVRLLALSAIPDAVTNVFVVKLRVAQHLSRAAALNVSMAATSLTAAWLLLPSLGIAALGYSWLGAQTLGATIPVVLIFVRRHHHPATPTAGE